MKVSVHIVTYNQDKYISKTLDSVLMQVVNFEYEIVIGDDCSTDSTRSILLDYKNNYPDKFKIFFNEKNLGAAENFIRSFKVCSGEYIAYLEGDDFWTCPTKLQKQVDLLDSHPETAICFHTVEVFYEDNSAPQYLLPAEHTEFSTIEDLLEFNNYIPSCSVMFRNKLFGDFPDWFSSSIAGDYPLNVLNAGHGNIGFIKDVMAAYRIHHAGTWSMQQEKNFEKNYIGLIELYNNFDVYFQKKYHTILKRKILEHELVLCHWYINKKRYKDFITLVVDILRKKPIFLSAVVIKHSFRKLFS